MERGSNGRLANNEQGSYTQAKDLSHHCLSENYLMFQPVQNGPCNMGKSLPVSLD